MDFDRNQPRVRKLLRQRVAPRLRGHEIETIPIVSISWILISIVFIFVSWLHWKLLAVLNKFSKNYNSIGFSNQTQDLSVDHRAYMSAENYTNFMMLDWQQFYERYEFWRPMTSFFYYPILKDKVVKEKLFSYGGWELSSIIGGILGDCQNLFIYWIGLLIVLFFYSKRLETEIFRGITKLYLRMLAFTWILCMAVCFYFQIRFQLHLMVYAVASAYVFDDPKRRTNYYLVWAAIRIGYLMKPYFYTQFTLEDKLADPNIQVTTISIIFGLFIGYIYRNSRQYVIQSQDEYRNFPGQGLAVHINEIR